MSRRNLLDDASGHHFVGDFASRPVADWPFLWLFAGHRHHLAGLLRRDLRRPSWLGDIPQALAHRDIFERDRLQANPTHAPGAHRIHTDAQLRAIWLLFFPSAAARIIRPRKACCWGVPCCARALPIRFSQHHSRPAVLVWDHALMSSSSPLVGGPILLHNYFSRNVLVAPLTAAILKNQLIAFT